MKKYKKLFIITILSMVVFSQTLIGAEGKKSCKKIEVVMAEILEGKNIEKRSEIVSRLKAEEVAIVSEVEGKVTKVNVNIGDIVTAGVVLVTINDGLSKEISNLEAKVKEWKKKLWKREHWKVRSERAEKNAKKNIEKYSKLLEEKKQESLKYIIKSNYSGVVSEIKVNEGEDVSKGDVVVVLKNPKKLFFQASVDKEEIPLFKEGEKFKIIVFSGNNKIEKEAIITSNSDGVVKFFVENEDNSVSEGDKVVLTFISLKKDNAIILSLKDMKKDDKGYYVYVPVFGEKDIHANKAYLKLKKYKDDLFVVMEGLRSGDILIKTGLDCLYPGKKIKIVVFSSKEKKYFLISNSKDLQKLNKQKKKVVRLEEPVKKVEAKKEKLMVEEKKAKKKEKIIKEKKKEVVKKKEKKSFFLKDRFYLGVVISSFHIADEDFSNFYKSSKVITGGELFVKIYKDFYIWGSVKKYEDNSFTTYYKKPINFKIYPNNFGLRYVFYKNPYFHPYVGFSINSYSYKELLEEKTVTASGNALGYGFDAGTFIYFGTLKFIGSNIYVRYNHVKDTINEKEFDLSGLEMVFGIFLRI